MANTKYFVDESFFNSIDTEAKAYVLGFISADGSITQDLWTFSIALQPGDIDHLYKIKAALQSEHRIYGPDKNGCYKLTIGSKKLVAALGRLGVTPNKSFTIEPCQLVPAFFKSHYWRGFVDGDGSLQFVSPDARRYKNYPRVNLCGNKAMVEGFTQWLWFQGVSKPNVAPKNNIFEVNYNGKNAIKVARMLYGRATFYLDRKKFIADRMTAMY